eukprot:m.179332 g.179332  ORF g.179332 m.179332 type:complete len:120 (+) comp24531_c0_seq5:203-562(+)
MPPIKHKHGAPDEGSEGRETTARLFPGTGYRKETSSDSPTRIERKKGKHIRVAAKTGERRTYAAMLKVAIKSCPHEEAHLSEIYDALKQTYPCFNVQPPRTPLHGMHIYRDRMSTNQFA